VRGGSEVRGFAHTLDERVEDCLSVLLNQIVDVAENATVSHVLVL
jgi:hypothetical protein